MVETTRLRPAAWNPRSIKRDAFEALKASIAADPDLLARRPILAQPNGEIVAGNMRFRAAVALGWKQVPAVLEKMSETLARARLMRDNVTAGEWEEQGLAELLYGLDAGTRVSVGFDEGELERLLATVEGDSAIPDEDIDLTPPAHPESRVGDRYELGPHRLVVGDATDERVWQALMGEDRAAAMWTDPPYGVEYQTKLSVEEAAARRRRKDGLEVEGDDAHAPELLRETMTLAKGWLPPGSPYYICAPNVHRFWSALEQAGCVPRQALVWVKDVFVMGRQDYHHQHETLLYGWMPGAAHSWYAGFDRTTLVRDDEKALKSMTREQLVELILEYRSSSSDVQRATRPKRSPEHPTMKPPQLIAPMLRNSTRKGQVVVDPFAGSGSTMVAAIATERRAAMIELDPRYADVVIRRWENLSGETVERPKRRRSA